MKPSAPLDRPLRVVALHHAPASAPRVSAKGQGELAERILELAHAHEVPVREDPDLLELLAACELGDAIPTELYQAVAELLVLLQQLNAADSRPVPGGSRPSP